MRARQNGKARAQSPPPPPPSGRRCIFRHRRRRLLSSAAEVVGARFRVLPHCKFTILVLHRTSARFNSKRGLLMAAILPRTALLLRTPRGAGRLARFLGAGVPAASSSDAETAAEFMPWRNGGGVLHRAASVDPSAVVEAGAVVHSGAVIGKEVVVGSGTVVGPSVSVGQSTRIGYNVVLSNCSVGEFCTIHNGACIGQDGFGFFVDQDGQVKKKPQELYARIGDNVEIGANTCIDRGSWRDTMIGDDTKIDNLVQVFSPLLYLSDSGSSLLFCELTSLLQIGHNVVIGKCCMICGQVGIAGSATLGDYVVLGGRVAIRDHVSIASKVRLAANSLATKDIQEPGDYGGFPAVPINEWRRQTVNLRLFSKKHHDRR
ncbi:probable UDP-3-O-acylglucosamine N-acyltransferase 2, mitochondrial isoform X1 [Triticum urartu]|uniref:probable UDP-3-O-acylglucosamine N-acyltransferase 2, mitochondrial isoform X1 n=1 Tax=Triticum urartu TaxID=4572 RepID=UPI002043DAFD|nr:probable UDP-3-O-acylglucosamine N-acyltransferase 2, mitochondrial isoform X1 [Triticum urartu]